MAGPMPSASRYYRPELDVVRFLAFFLVFLTHTLPLRSDPHPRLEHLLGGLTPALYSLQPACSFGLSLFFTLSAFLICELLLREREFKGEIGIKQFYIRRVLRIWPLYYFALILGMIVLFLPGGQTGAGIGIGWFAVFMGSWYSAFFGFLRSPAFPLWSVSVEEQFYLFVPWIANYFTRKALYGFCGALILVSNSLLFYFGRAGTVHHRIWCDSFVQFECFAAGILLCLVLRGRLPAIATRQRIALIGFGFFCWFYACYGLNTILFDDGSNPGSWALMGGYALSATGSVLVLIAFLGVDAKLLPKWAIELGRISFGLYVYHDFALYIRDRIPLGAFLVKTVPYHLLRISLNVGLGFCIPLGLTLLMAMISYRYLETPFLKMKKRHAVIESQPIQESSVGFPTEQLKNTAHRRPAEMSVRDPQRGTSSEIA